MESINTLQPLSLSKIEPLENLINSKLLRKILHLIFIQPPFYIDLKPQLHLPHPSPAFATSAFLFNNRHLIVSPISLQLFSHPFPLKKYHL